MNFHPTLGIIAVNVKDVGAEVVSGLRIPSGVLVVARTEVSSGNEVPLVAGDVIHAVNTITVGSVDVLRVLVESAQANTEPVLQIERNGQLQFVTCRIY